MEYKLKDVLPFYLGCDFWTANSEGNLNAATLENVMAMIDRGVKVQLHLKRPQSMTSAEMVQRNFTSATHLKTWLEYNAGKWPFDDLIWFTRNHYDLFGFIESEDAIDIHEISKQS